MVRKNRKKEAKLIAGQSDASADDEVSVRPWREAESSVNRPFGGPRGAKALLRVGMTKEAMAELSLHARESLEAEVCGVLVGEICTDEAGLFVDVFAVIRGTSSERSSRHVTFTQETWNEIHAELQSRYPKLSIVGWYHSHPGFGVEFSEMDAFVHQNFFPSRRILPWSLIPWAGIWLSA